MSQEYFQASARLTSFISTLKDPDPITLLKDKTTKLMP